MHLILALTVKDLRLLTRDKAGCFFTFIFPLAFCVFFGLVMSQMGRGESGPIPVAIVDEDGTADSQAFVDRLAAGKRFDVVRMELGEAEEAVRRGRRVAYIRLPNGFGAASGRMMFSNDAPMEVGIDPSRQAEGAMLQGLLTEASFQHMMDLFSDSERLKKQTDAWLADIAADTEMNPMVRVALSGFLPTWANFMGTLNQANSGADGGNDQPSGGFNPAPIKMVDVLRKRTGPTNIYAITFPQGVIWAVLSGAVGVGISLVTERTQGTMTRLLASPITPAQLLAGKAGASAVTTLGVSLALFTIARIVFGVRPTSVLWLAITMVCIAVCFIGLMTLAGLAKSEQTAGAIGTAAMMIMAMLGGGMIPYMFLPESIRTISHVSPVKWSILAMEGALWRGFSAAEMLKPCLVLLAIGVVSFIIGARGFSRRLHASS